MRLIVNKPEEERSTDIGNMHKKLVKIALVVPEISSRTNTQTHRQAYSSQYFATATADEVNITPSDIRWCPPVFGANSRLHFTYRFFRHSSILSTTSARC